MISFSVPARHTKTENARTQTVACCSLKKLVNENDENAPQTEATVYQL